MVVFADLMTQWQIVMTSQVCMMKVKNTSAMVEAIAMCGIWVIINHPPHEKK
jgi:hypothetical protein